MKAFILAAGFGARLRPFTNDIPKPLLPIGGKPLLEYHLDSLRAHGINEVLINSHYLAEKVKEFVDSYELKKPGMKIVLTYEPKLLGSGGTIKANRDFLSDGEDVVVTYGDNLTNIHYGNLIEHHKKMQGVATIATWDEPLVESKSMVITDSNFRVSKFVEKPKTEDVAVRRSGGGVYIFSPSALRLIQDFVQEPLDLGRHILPSLVIEERGVYEYPLVAESLLDIGTPESYKQAEELVKILKF